MKNSPRPTGFTLIELLIAINMMMLLIVPLTAVYLLPLRVHANLVDIGKSQSARQRLQQHLAADLRSAESVEVREDGTLLVNTAGESVKYAFHPDESRREADLGGTALIHRFPNVTAQCLLDKSGRSVGLQANVTTRYRLLRGEASEVSTFYFSSNLPTGEAKP